MGTEKRARQKEQSRTRAEQARKEAEATARRKRFISLSSIVVVLAAVVGLIAFLSSGDDDTTTAESETSTTAATTTTVAGETTTTAFTEAAPGSAPCPEADGSSERRTEFDGPPEMCIDTAKTYTAEVETNEGTFTIQFDAQKAPKTVNNFVFLARYHYFDGLIFHRIIDGFVIQGGDPQGTGQGGPGYSFGDELPSAGEYQKYSVAMANSGPNTNGSQFFVITGDQGVQLPPQYSLFGKVVDGTDVVDKIGKAETENERPKSEIKMTKVTISES